MRARIRTRLADESGFSLIELLAAMVVLTIGIVALAGTLDGSRSLANTSERLTAASAVAERQLETVLGRSQSGVYSTLGMQAPLVADSTHEVLRFVCGVNTGDTRASFRFDQTTCPSTSPFGEEMVIAASGGVDEEVPWSDARTGARGNIYTVITEVDDDCADAPRASAACDEEDLRRVTVMVTTTNGAPDRPVVVSTLVPNSTKYPDDCGQCINPFTRQGLQY